MTTTIADRLTNVDTASDPNAILGVEGIGQSPRDEITVVNNADSTMEVTVSTTNLRIQNTGSDHQAVFTLGQGGEQLLRFAPESGNVDDVSFDATVLEGGSQTGSIQFDRTITIPSDPSTRYRIQNVNSGLVLSPRFQWRPSIHLNVVQESANASTLRQWTLSDNSDGTVTIVNEVWGGALGIRNGSTSDGANVSLRFGTQADTRWNLVPTSNGAVGLLNDSTGLAAEVEDGSTATGANVVQAPWTGDESPVPSQEWQLVPV